MKNNEIWTKKKKKKKKKNSQSFKFIQDFLKVHMRRFLLWLVSVVFELFTFFDDFFFFVHLYVPLEF